MKLSNKLPVLEEVGNGSANQQNPTTQVQRSIPDNDAVFHELVIENSYPIEKIITMRYQTIYTEKKRAPDFVSFTLFALYSFRRFFLVAGALLLVQKPFAAMSFFLLFR